MLPLILVSADDDDARDGRRRGRDGATNALHLLISDAPVHDGHGLAGAFSSKISTCICNAYLTGELGFVTPADGVNRRRGELLVQPACPPRRAERHRRGDQFSSTLDDQGLNCCLGFVLKATLTVRVFSPTPHFAWRAHTYSRGGRPLRVAAAHFTWPPTSRGRPPHCPLHVAAAHTWPPTSRGGRPPHVAAHLAAHFTWPPPTSRVPLH
jgi:hypothetical protein